MPAAHGCTALHGMQITSVSLHQGVGDGAFFQQMLHAVDIGHDAFQKAHALNDACLNLRPVLRRQDQWQQVQRPRALWLVGIGVDVVGHAVVAHLSHHGLMARWQTLNAVCAQMR